MVQLCEQMWTVLGAGGQCLCGGAGWVGRAGGEDLGFALRGKIGPGGGVRGYFVGVCWRVVLAVERDV